MEDTQSRKGLDVRERGVVQVTPGRDARAQRVVDHNRHWTLVDGVGIDGCYLVIVVGDGPAVCGRADGILLLHGVDEFSVITQRRRQPRGRVVLAVFWFKEKKVRRR